MAALMQAKRHAMELKTLHLLCAVCVGPERRTAICRELQAEAFLDASHRIVFEEIRALGTLDTRRLREFLPARIANRGFPDFPLEELFSPEFAMEESLAELIHCAKMLASLTKPAR